ncbi:hypothetical protein Cgig2_009667 [Carnegiea gigantea]|uniref:Uncharacterized protein n=1 Tax=Carnegiea gigantea TaxID=171969 RepID=A0A9Q1JS49_9CARY|nr:hypothetical protein Cgig2_009667 [Carnegiea gigantea]
MGVSACCCLKPLAPLPTRPFLDPASSSPSLFTGTNLAPSFVRRKCDGRSLWKSNQMVGLACSMIIGLEMVDLMGNIGHNAAYSMANEIANESQMILPDKKDKPTRVAKWSEKRVCPPWHLNSLETIVPEDLPRPSAHRKWEWVSSSSQWAPVVKSSVKSRNTSCFSL